ncbi:MAG TPA: hypothetical protein VME46_09195, partial [Acidimicrobiales bacterium]|nr:hypothetical protein [Acidimicrobiales bacterium]
VVAAPGEGEQVSWSPLFDLRLVRGPGTGGDEGARSACSWFRLLEDLGEGPASHSAGLAYASDSGPAWLVHGLHEQACAPEQPWRPISLDHGIWFHRPFRADEWLLLEASTNSLHNSIGLATGRVFSGDGRLVASIAQEVLLRRPRSVPRRARTGS